MSSLYTKRGWYYLSVMRGGKRETRALGTKNLRITQKLRPAIEDELLKAIHLPKAKSFVTFNELVKIYLKSNPQWSKSTLRINTQRLNRFIKNGLPEGRMTREQIVPYFSNDGYDVIYYEFRVYPELSQSKLLIGSTGRLTMT